MTLQKSILPTIVDYRRSCCRKDPVAASTLHTGISDSIQRSECCFSANFLMNVEELSLLCFTFIQKGSSRATVLLKQRWNTPYSIDAFLICRNDLQTEKYSNSLITYLFLESFLQKIYWNRSYGLFHGSDIRRKRLIDSEMIKNYILK